MFRTIVVGVSKHDTARSACAQAFELARMSGGTLHLVYAIDQSDSSADAAARNHAEGLLASFVMSHAQPAEVHVMADRPDQAITDVARRVQADLVVVGNKGMTRWGRFTRATPARVLRRAHTNVLVLDTTH
jgi:nucleotide-binding universal stress UspA family protein